MHGPNKPRVRLIGSFCLTYTRLRVLLSAPRWTLGAPSWTQGAPKWTQVDPGGCPSGLRGPLGAPSWTLSTESLRAERVRSRRGGKGDFDWKSASPLQNLGVLLRTKTTCCPRYTYHYIPNNGGLTYHTIPYQHTTPYHTMHTLPYHTLHTVPVSYTHLTLPTKA